MLGAKARSAPKRIVFAEGDNVNILKAAQIVLDEGIGFPTLLGDVKKIEELADLHKIDISEMPVINPRGDEAKAKREEYVDLFYKKKGT
ncbi:hypothetical protein LWM68_38010 [Niabella sp. W65]|nr:hypothetical protein [Niabella sp. W65]MCH7368026.1 hypothetical protein [Niabella sp. W65]